MRRNSTSSIGALHPIIFFTLVYGISLLMAIFVCRTVYYSMNDQKQEKPAETSYTVLNSNATALK